MTEKEKQYNKKYCREYYRKRIEDDPEYGRKQNRKYREKCLRENPTEYRGRCAERTAKYRRTHPELRDKFKEQRRKYNLNDNYGLTSGKWDELYAQQKGVCKLCGKKRKLAVDHDHKSGLIRGLLCTQCNAGLGMFHDSKEILIAAIAYVEKS